MVNTRELEAERERRKSAKALVAPLDCDDSIKEMSQWGGNLFLISHKKIIRVRLAEKIDPNVTATNVPDEQLIFLEIGCENPIVSRTIIQTKKLLNCLVIENTELHKQVCNISWEVMMSLASLNLISDEYKEEIEKAKSTVAETDFSKETGLILPTVPGFTLKFRSYVLEIKRVLNIISRLYAVLLGWNINEGHFHKVRERAEREFGSDDQVVRLLDVDKDWLEILIELRNTIEHPKDGKSVEIDNFRLLDNMEISLPTWSLTGSDYNLSRPQDTEAFFSQNIERALKFFEETLCATLLKREHPIPGFIGFELIEDSKIDRKCPLRWQQAFK